MPDENETFPVLCKKCGDKQPYQLVKRILDKAEEWSIQCATCGAETHSYYTNDALNKKLHDILAKKNPTRKAHAIRYYQRKFDEFNRSMIGNGA
jgi:protein-arginine kinase activator protein McsA